MRTFAVTQHILSNVQVSQEGDEVRSTSCVLAVRGWKGDDGAVPQR